MKLNMEQIEKEMQVIADSGMEEILILTGESRAMVMSNTSVRLVSWQENISVWSVWKFIL